MYYLIIDRIFTKYSILLVLLAAIGGCSREFYNLPDKAFKKEYKRDSTDGFILYFEKGSYADSARNYIKSELPKFKKAILKK